MAQTTPAQRAAAHRAEIRQFVDGLAGAALIEQHPRYFAALCSWSYELAGDTAGLWWTSPGQGLVDHAADPARLAAPQKSAQTGYDAGVFYHPTSRALILVNRGTDEEADWGANIGGYLGIGHKQFDEALDYAAAAWRLARDGGLDVRVMILTGHSLGGGLVELQAACLPSLLKAEQAPPLIHGFGFASAPFRKEIAAAWSRLNTGASKPSDWEILLPNLHHWTRKGDPIRSPVGYTDYGVIGRVTNNLPEVYVIWRNPAVISNHHGGTNYSLSLGRPGCHSIFRYFKYWDTPPEQCVVVNPNDDDFPLLKAPTTRHFNSIPARFR
eukprot:gene20097-20004_t